MVAVELVGRKVASAESVHTSIDQFRWKAGQMHTTSHLTSKMKEEVLLALERQWVSAVRLEGKLGQSFPQL